MVEGYSCGSGRDDRMRNDRLCGSVNWLMMKRVMVEGGR